MSGMAVMAPWSAGTAQAVEDPGVVGVIRRPRRAGRRAPVRPRPVCATGRAAPLAVVWAGVPGAPRVAAQAVGLLVMVLVGLAALVGAAGLAVRVALGA